MPVALTEKKLKIAMDTGAIATARVASTRAKRPPPRRPAIQPARKAVAAPAAAGSTRRAKSESPKSAACSRSSHTKSGGWSR
jgi:hypothetical protein